MKRSLESTTTGGKAPLSINTHDEQAKSSAEAASGLLQMLQMTTPQSAKPKPTEVSPKKKAKLEASVPSYVKYLPDEDGLSGSGWRSWSHEEEVFLIGAVMERFFARGSLSSTKRKKNEPESCWTSIKKTYDTAWKSYSSDTGHRSPSSRSENALARHYKVMKERIMHGKTEDFKDFRNYYNEWENEYNAGNCLVAVCEGNSKSVNEDAMSGIGGIDSARTRGPFEDLPKSRWSHEEEVFLVAAVLERFFQRGSLASTRGDAGASECWASIKALYDTLRANYTKNNGTKIKMQRSSPALARHFKVMKVRFTDSNGKENLKTYYNDWKRKYNVNEVLLKSDGAKKRMVSASPSVGETIQTKNEEPTKNNKLFPPTNTIQPRVFQNYLGLNTQLLNPTVFQNGSFPAFGANLQNINLLNSGMVMPLVAQHQNQSQLLYLCSLANGEKPRDQGHGNSQVPPTTS